MAVPQYNVNPGTQSGSGAYGSVPGLIGLPPNLYTQTAGQFAGVNPAGGNASNFIQAETAGQVAPDTADYIQRQAAARGVASGMPGSDFSSNNLVESLGLESQNLAHQGVNDYLSFITGQGSQMNNPELSYTVAQQNAIDQSAPNPAAAAAQMQSLLNQGTTNSKGGILPMSGGATAGISSTYANPGFNDPGNPAILYGPGGGPGTSPYTDMYAGASPYAASNPSYDPYDPMSSLGLGLDIGLGSMGGGGGDDYFSGGQASQDMSDLYSDTGA